MCVCVFFTGIFLVGWLVCFGVFLNRFISTYWRFLSPDYVGGVPFWLLECCCWSAVGYELALCYVTGCLYFGLENIWHYGLAKSCFKPSREKNPNICYYYRYQYKTTFNTGLFYLYFHTIWITCVNSLFNTSSCVWCWGKE